MAARFAQVGWNAVVENRRFDGLKDVLLVRSPQPPGIDGDEQVRRTVLGLVADAFDQGVAAAFDQIDLDARALLKAFVERQVRIVVARRVDVDDARVLRANRVAGRGESREKQEGEETHWATPVNANDSQY